MEIDLKKVVASVDYDGTEDSVKDFIPSDLYSIVSSTNQLLLRNPGLNKVYTGNTGDKVLKDCYDSFYIVTPQVYKQLFESLPKA